MNVYLWIGVVATAVLLLSLVIDRLEFFDLDFAGDLLSLPVIAAFVGAFGFTAGALADSIGYGVAAVPGVAAGVVFGYGAGRLSRSMKNAPVGRTDSSADLLGSMGKVVSPVGPDHLGEVLLRRPHGPVKVAARSDRPVGMGVEVVVVDVSSSTLVEVAVPGWDADVKELS